MRKVFCLLALSSLWLTSCSSSDSSSSNTSTDSDVLVTKVEQTYANDGSTIITNYTYNGKKMTGSTDNEGYYETYTYNGDFITSIKTFDDSDALVQDETFAYNGSGQLTTYLSLDYENDHGRREVFVYNGDGTVSMTVYGGTATQQTNVESTGIVSFSGGEVTHIDVAVDAFGYSYTRAYTYDTKNSPFKNVIGADKLNFLEQEALGVAHNILTEHYTSTSFDDDMYVTTYTYNSLNFPLTAVEMEDDDMSTMITTHYTYN